MKEPDILIVLRPVTKAFEELGVRYYVGGSVASSAHGIARATLDVDLASDLKPGQVRLLVDMLQRDYYIDDTMIREAISNRSSFNLIHLETMLKVDVFVVPDIPYYRDVFSRSRKITLDEDFASEQFYLASPEDIILNKLDWFKKGEEVSERQWHDVLGILKVQGESLDMSYLRTWALKLKLSELLERAIRDIDPAG